MSKEVRKLTLAIDQYCVRLNPGLAAVAIALGIVLLATAADRAGSIVLDALASTPPGYPSALAVPAISD